MNTNTTVTCRLSEEEMTAWLRIFRPNPADASVFLAANPFTLSLGMPEDIFRTESEIAGIRAKEEYAAVPRYCSGIFVGLRPGDAFRPYTAYLQDVEEEPECFDEEDVFVGWVFYRNSADWDAVKDLLDPIEDRLLTDFGRTLNTAASSTYSATTGRRWLQWKKHLLPLPYAVGTVFRGAAERLQALTDRLGLGETPMSREEALKHADAHGFDRDGAKMLLADVRFYGDIAKAARTAAEYDAVYESDVASMELRLLLLQRYAEAVIEAAG